MSKPKTALNFLKKALINLPETGPTGFEGLVSILLGDVANASFRLAASGSQGGQDGRGFADENIISYEAKLYTKKISKSVVLNKVAESIANPEPPDVWVLTATVGASSQIVDSLRAILDKTGTTLLVLDWPEGDPIPPLALLCSIASNALTEFYHANNSPNVSVEDLSKHLQEISSQPGFEARAEDLKTKLSSAAFAPANMLSANRQQLHTAFSNTQKARQRFGQPISPAASSTLETVDRDNRSDIDHLFVDTPSEELVFIIGDEGCGKSWSIAQAWLAQDEPPLTIFLTASEAAAIQSASAVSAMAGHIIKQSGDLVTNMERERWERRLRSWTNKPISKPRLILVIDGLNEQASIDWPSLLTELTSFIVQIGGRVIATCRTRFFLWFKDRISTAFKAITISNFSDSELNAILIRQHINPTSIASKVRPFLRNPRLLAIALQLLNKEQIKNAQELSIERLLFEHIKQQSLQSSAKTPIDFARVLAAHAKTIQERIEADATEDQLVFDRLEPPVGPLYDLPSQLLPVVEERFFEVLEDDSSLYKLSKEGLSYGLAIATIRELQAAERNNISVYERLAIIVEPIAALDKVSDILFAALHISTADANLSNTIRSGLLSTYLDQQNINDDHQLALYGLVRGIPDASLDALYYIDTEKIRIPRHKDWLIAALHAATQDPTASQVISKKISSWLRMYSLSPELSVMPIERDQSEKARAIQESKEKIDNRLQSLSDDECFIREHRMERNDNVETATLSDDCFSIISNLPLAPFAEPLAYWAFGRALNSKFDEPWRNYGFLIQHNHEDWFETRQALLQFSSCFSSKDASKVGRWALVYLLRATGSLDDAERAEKILDSLSERQEHLGNWRIVENYCASDPCDPSSVKPENLESTAQRYRNLDARDIMVNRWVTEEDNFFRDAVLGLARFDPEPAVSVYDKVIIDLAARESSIAVLALNWLESAAPLLRPETIDAMLERSMVLSKPAPPDQQATDNQDWVVSQFLLMTALSHMDGDDQLAALWNLPRHGPPLAQLECVFKVAQPQSVDDALERAIIIDDENRLLMVLAFIKCQPLPLSESTLTNLYQLVSHTCQAVRGLAMGLLARCAMQEQLEDFVRSDWTASSIDLEDNFFERWHGSSLIISAAEAGLMLPDEAIYRITPERFSHAVERLPNDDIKGELCTIFSQLTDPLFEASLSSDTPAVSQRHTVGEKDSFPRFYLDKENLSFEESIRRANEEEQDASIRQNEMWNRFGVFKANLIREGADLILRDIGSSAIRAIADNDVGILQSFADRVLGLPNAMLPRVSNLAAHVALALSSIDSTRAVALFRLISGQKGYVRVTRTWAEIPLATWNVWHSDMSDQLSVYLEERLNSCVNDHDLATETFTAMLSGQKDFIERYADKLIESGHPVDLCRALTVLGYLDRSPYSESILDTFTSTSGIVGTAARSAMQVYTYNQWTRIWFSKITETDDPVDYWRYSCLFSKIVDTRFILWRDEWKENRLLSQFGWGLDKAIQRRLKSWQQKRKEKLFGGNIPAPYLLR